MAGPEGRDLGGRLAGYRSARRIPAPSEILTLFSEVNEILATEDPRTRPRASSGDPGGLIYLDRSLPTALLPDIHARPGLLLAALGYRPAGRQSVMELLSAGAMQFVCLGDYFHGEGRVRRRWKRAFDEFSDGFRTHTAMDEEMTESLAVLMMVASLKTTFPARVHLLKGNHENVTNESGGGNYPFGKYAYEGAMVLDYLQLRYNDEVIARLYEFEKRLPLLAVGERFIITHAEPARFFSREEVVEYRTRDEVVYGLTWTDNDQAEANAVERMLAHYLGSERAERALHFGGHRPVTGSYNLRAGGRYVQIHNPSRYIMALLPPDRPVDPERDVVDLGAGEDAIDGQGA